MRNKENRKEVRKVGLQAEVEDIFEHTRYHARSTRERYKSATFRFCDYLAENYKILKLQNVREDHISSYVSALRQQELSEGYIRTEINAIYYTLKYKKLRNKLPEVGHFLCQKQA